MLPPAAASTTTGVANVFWEGTQAQLCQAVIGSTPTGPQDLGFAPLGSAPAAAVLPTSSPSGGTLEVVWTGTGSAFKTQQPLYWASNGSGGWQSQGNICGCFIPQNAAPTVDAWGTEIDIFWKGDDGNLWEVYSQDSGASWSPVCCPPAHPGNFGPLGSNPVAIAHPNGEEDVFWKGMDGNLWEAFYAYGKWFGPQINGNFGPLGSAPAAAINPTTGEEDLFWKGMDGNLWEAFYANGKWYGPQTNGNFGPLGSSPTATDHGSEEDVFWQGADRDLWEARYLGGWSGPTPLHMGPLG